MNRGHAAFVKYHERPADHSSDSQNRGTHHRTTALAVMATAFPETTSMRQTQGPCLPLPILKLKKKIPSVTYYEEGIFISQWDRGGPI